MKIVHMIDDYRLLCREAQQVGNFEAYKAYTEKYPYFFPGVFRDLYRQPLEFWQEMIQQIDFTALLQAAEENYASDMVNYTIACVQRFMDKMKVDFDFTLLLGVELGNIGGCASPADWDEPCLFIGMDRPLEKEQIDLLVTHELCHLMRSHFIRDLEPETVFSRTIEEGLASYASLWEHDLDWNLMNVAKTLAVSEVQADNLLEATDTLLEKLALDGDQPLSFETMKAYFTADSGEAEYPVIGYYVGLHLAHESVEKGVPFEKMVTMPRQELIRLWFR